MNCNKSNKVWKHQMLFLARINLEEVKISSPLSSNIGYPLFFLYYLLLHDSAILSLTQTQQKYWITFFTHQKMSSSVMLSRKDKESTLY